MSFRMNRMVYKGDLSMRSARGSSRILEVPTPAQSRLRLWHLRLEPPRLEPKGLQRQSCEFNQNSMDNNMDAWILYFSSLLISQV